MENPRFVPVGKIVRTHGVKGGLKVFPYGDSMETLGAGTAFLLRPERTDVKAELTLQGVQRQGKLLLVRFGEITDMDGAQTVIGEELFLPEDRLPPVEEGEYYHYQLIGLSVETVGGMKVGVLRSIMESGASDIYVVDDGGGREVLIPAVEEVIREIDLERGIMVIDPPEGLIE
ncbi:MAG: ribosome maturation factor RimM [Acidobacteriota bacterium]